MIKHMTVAFAALAMSASAALAFDVDAGATVFNKCKACHMVGADAKNRVGPTLNGVVGRDWGAIEGFKYSEKRDGTLLKMKEDDPSLVWDVATLTAYLTKPKDVIPKGKMAFAGLRKAEDIENVIGYLAQYDADGNEVDPAPVVEAASGEAAATN